MPASVVTSVNSIAPEGLGGVGLGDGDAMAAAVSDAGAAGAAVGDCLHEVNPRQTSKKKEKYRRVMGLN
jgi:2C-methyl-D-erythritol 2,4-cyclodiphosphate synthase